MEYTDGNERQSVSGAAAALTFIVRPVAIVGGATDDGIPRLLQPGYLILGGIDK